MTLLFGDFLLERGLVSEQALNNALEAQFRDQILIGQLAVEEGFLSHDQVIQILRIQKNAAADADKFGRIGVELGILTDEARLRLLEKQEEKTDFLGNILVSQGVLDPRQLVNAIKEHDALQIDDAE